MFLEKHGIEGNHLYDMVILMITLYFPQDLKWLISYNDMDKMLERINYVRSNESNKIKSDGKRTNRCETTD